MTSLEHSRWVAICQEMQRHRLDRIEKSDIVGYDIITHYQRRIEAVVATSEITDAEPARAQEGVRND